MLCRDIIADFIDKKGENGADENELVEKLRHDILEKNHNWLRDVLLFDHEVEEISNKEKCNDDNCRRHTKGIDDFAYSYFSYLDIDRKRNSRKKGYHLPAYDKDLDEKSITKKDYSLEINLRNGRKVYVAKFWGVNDVYELMDILNTEYHCDYTSKVEQKY